MDDVQAVASVTGSGGAGSAEKAKSRAELEAERTAEFLKVLREIDAQQETPAQRAERKRAEKAEQEAKARKQKKIADLRSLIAKLRSRLYANGKLDTGVAAQLSAAETELFWLMFSF